MGASCRLVGAWGSRVRVRRARRTNDAQGATVCPLFAPEMQKGPGKMPGPLNVRVAES